MLIITGISCAAPVEVITNGGFETGDFTGWTVINPAEPLYPWSVAPPYPIGNIYFTAVTPVGNYMAVNGFDAAGPVEFIIYQDVDIPAGTATLSWKDSMSWLALESGSAPRIFEVLICDPNTDATLDTLYSDSVEYDGLFDSGVGSAQPLQQHNVDLSDYAGSTVRLCFVEIIPEAYTGPGHFEIDDISLMVEANVAPDVSEAFPSMDTLWSPNKKYVDINIQGVTDPDGDEFTIEIISITSDEPTTAGGKKMAPDADPDCIGTDTAMIRAERDGNGNGRVYEITFVATDSEGAQSEGTVTVCVPHDQGEGSVCIDDGQLYDATGIN